MDTIEDLADLIDLFDSKSLEDFYKEYEQYAEEYASRSYNTILEHMEGAFEQNEEML